jgi:DNA repair protein RadC
MAKQAVDEQPEALAGHRSRLRERFRKAGLRGFHDYEVLELLLTFAVPRRNVKPTAKDLVKRFGGLRRVFDASLEDLQGVPGVGQSAAVLIKFLKEAASLYLEEGIRKQPIVDSPETVIDYCRHNLLGQHNELFQVIYLNPQNEVIDLETVAEGTVDHTAVYPRRIIEGALRHNAVGLIFVHNHPDGNAEASDADRRLTQALAQAAGSVGIAVHDHLIIGRDGCFSFRAHGWIET